MEMQFLMIVEYVLEVILVMKKIVTKMLVEYVLVMAHSV